MIQVNLLNDDCTKNVKVKNKNNTTSNKSFKDCVKVNGKSSNKNINKLNKKDNLEKKIETSDLSADKSDGDKIKDSKFAINKANINENKINAHKTDDDTCDDLNVLMKIIQDLINLLKLSNSDIKNISEKIVGVSDNENLKKNLCSILFYLKNNLKDNSKVNFIKNKLLQNIKFNGDNLVINSDKINELVSKLNINNKEEVYNESNFLKLLLNKNGQDVNKNISSEKNLVKDVKNMLLKISNNENLLKKVDVKTNLKAINNNFKHLLNNNTKINLSSNVDLKNSNNESNKSNKDFKVLNDILNDSNSDSGSKIKGKINNAMNIMAHIPSLDSMDSSEIMSKLQNVIVNKNNFVGDIIKTVSYMSTNNLKNLTVKIVPKELGEIVISMISQDGNMKLAMKASNKDTLNLLNANLNDIVGELNSQNIKIQPAQVNIYNEDASFFSNQFNQQSNNGGDSNNKNSQSDFGFLGEENNEENNESVTSKIYDSNQINTFV